MVAAIWLYSALLVLPTVLSWHGEFGFAKELGKCDYLKPGEGTFHPRKLYMSIGPVATDSLELPYYLENIDPIFILSKTLLVS